MILVLFFTWTLILYWVHRIVHSVSTIRHIHMHHHRYILSHTTNWHWSNLFLFNDDWISTLDLWITEVLPTILFCYITDQYWIFVLYYIWAAFIQEAVEHNKNFDLPVLTSGKWHLIHHTQAKNYGLFLPLWDLIFGTYKNVHK